MVNLWAEGVSEERAREAMRLECKLPVKCKFKNKRRTKAELRKAGSNYGNERVKI